MKTIEKKIWSEYFDAVASGKKNFELRLADWDIEIGDTLILKEWNHKNNKYTGREIKRAVTYLIKTKGAENWGMWSKEDIEKYGFQIIGFGPEKTKVKVLVFTEGTILMASTGLGMEREERVKQVIRNEPPIDDFKSYIPVGNAVETLNYWISNGCEIYYLTSRRTLEEITAIQDVLLRNKFPSGTLLYRKPGEEYKDVVERLMPDVLIEDDCESIGGEPEMIYPHIKPELKPLIKHFTIKEFGGIDHLKEKICQISKIS
ncbi:DUF3850 domain-containing protein [Patescibacteria group bacterium]|nr:DUF3850 domain-containing protein [Patescibacteria group bacterium]HOM77705.1 DUF3850 domain-containing protein [bacterium]